jgi:hypothetical protein
MAGSGGVSEADAALRSRQKARGEGHANDGHEGGTVVGGNLFEQLPVAGREKSGMDDRFDCTNLTRS